MSGVIFVSPQNYLITGSEWKSHSQKSGYIPILEADLPKLQQSLQRVVETQGKLKSSSLTGLPDATNGMKQEKSPSAGLGGKSSVNHTEVKYQSLKQFLPISLGQQLHTISLQSVPNNLSNDNLERFILKCIELSLEILDVRENSKMLLECWTIVQFPGLETQDLFIRFTQGNEKLYCQICKVIHSLLSGSDITIELHLDTNTKNFIEDHCPRAPEVLPNFGDSLKSFLKDLKSQKLKVSDENLSSESYQIDLNTLSDLPRDSLDQLCRDITEFRTKVVSIEKEKRENEMYEENKRRKQQMMKMFHQIKKSQSDEIGSDDDNNDEEDEDLDFEEDTHENDEASETRRLEREKEESTKRYQNMLTRLQSQIEPRIRSVQGKIRRAKNYKEELLKQRPLYLKQLLHQAHDQYYDHHRSFKEAEEQKDASDRAQYQDQEKTCTTTTDTNGSPLRTVSTPDLTATTDKLPQDSRSELSQKDAHPEQFKIKFAFKKAIDKSTVSEIPIEKVSEFDYETDQLMAEPLADDLPFSQAQLDLRLHSLRASKILDELIKEYLGVYEDELVDYILDNIRQHKNKQVLFDELKETFDDDAQTIVDAIWTSKPFTTLAPSVPQSDSS